MIRTRFSLPALAIALGTAVSAPVSADPTFGIGFSIAFGGGQPQVGAGLRVYSDDDEDEVAASLGLDYLFTSQGLRPTIGAAYLMDNSYIGLDLGYDITRGSIDFGAGAGFAETDDDSGGGNAGNVGRGGGVD